MNRVSKAYWLWCQFNDNDMTFLNGIQNIVNKNLNSPKFQIHLTLLGPFIYLNENQKNLISKYSKIISSEINTIEMCGGGSARCMMAEIFLPKK